MTGTLGRLILYAKDIPAMVAFYTTHFGYTELRRPGDRLVELRPAGMGLSLLLHPASKGQRQGQAQVKLVFDVVDVPGFVEDCASTGLTFGPLHKADGYVFANAKDPSGNSVQISSRAFSRSLN